MALTDEIEEQMKLTKRQLAILDILPRHLAGCDRLSEVYETMERDLGAERPDGLGYAPVTVLERILFPQLYSAKYGQPVEGENNFRHYSAKDKPVSLDPDIFQRLQTQDKTTKEGTTYFPFRATRLLDNTLLGAITIGKELSDAEANMLKDYATAVGVELSPRYFRKERDRLREQEREELQKKRERMHQLMRDAIHDLRGRLTPLTGYNSMLIRLLEEGTGERRIAEKMATFLGEEAKELDYFQDVFAGRSPEKTPANLYLLVGDALEELKPVMQNRTVENALERTKYIATVDETAMKIVVRELLRNATKYSKEDGTITISGDKEDGVIHLYFTNTGRIPVEELPKIFDLGYGKGTGFGLDYVKRAVEEEHHGKIMVSSTEQEVVFEVVLPLAS